MWAFGSNTLTVMLEWTLQDAHGNTVWVDIVKGDSNSGWGGKGGGKDEQGRQRATGAGNPGWFGWERAVGSAEGDL